MHVGSRNLISSENLVRYLLVIFAQFANNTHTTAANYFYANDITTNKTNY